jgi:hypothetical protein
LKSSMPVVTATWVVGRRLAWAQELEASQGNTERPCLFKKKKRQLFWTRFDCIADRNHGWDTEN